MQLTTPDESLMERIKQGDTRALDLLFNQYYDAVCSIIYYFTGDKELTEELGADVFIKLWNKRNDITITQNTRAYLLTMARNIALAELRTKKNVFIDPDAADLETPLVSHIQDPEDALISRQSLQQVSEAVKSISYRSRVIFCLSRDEGLKYREIADLLNISEKAVEHHMGKALRYLKSMLHDIVM